MGHGWNFAWNCLVITVAELHAIAYAVAWHASAPSIRLTYTIGNYARDPQNPVRARLSRRTTLVATYTLLVSPSYYIQPDYQSAHLVSITFWQLKLDLKTHDIVCVIDLPRDHT
jgi:hypothetical protein